MAEFHGIFHHPFLPSVLLIEGGVGGGKNHCLRQPVSSHDAYTVANDNSGPRSQCEQTQVPTAQLAFSMHGCHCSSHDFEGSAKCISEKQTS